MKTIDLKSKPDNRAPRPYVMVNERVKEFRTNEKFTNYSMSTKWHVLLKDDAIADTVCCTAIITDENDRVVATGTATEIRGSSFINKTSHVENCETSAWGRALGCLGIGIDASIASLEEVENAKEKQRLLSDKPAAPKQQSQQSKIALKQIKEECIKLYKAVNGSIKNDFLSYIENKSIDEMRKVKKTLFEKMEEQDLSAKSNPRGPSEVKFKLGEQ